MLVTAVVLPHPPLLIPEVAAGASAELDDLRTACLDAVTAVARARRDGCDVVVVGGAPVRATFTPGSSGTFAGFGVKVDVTLPGSPLGEPGTGHLPLSLSVASWLMEQVSAWDGPGGSVRAEAVPFDLPRAEAQALGRDWATSGTDLALIVMGDGSNALSTKAPGYLVRGAEEWQSVATAALSGGDVESLASLRRDDAERFGAAGYPAWQALVGAVGQAAVQGKQLAADDRYGVAYVVAHWSTAGPAA